MMLNTQQRINILKRASLCRHFEQKVYEAIQNKRITIPVYLSLGQEFISATIAYFCEQNNIKPLLFPQHRCHSTFLSFGGNPSLLIDKLLGKVDPMEGSASIQCKEIQMYGHDGLLGTQVPIATGACFASKQPTICFLGDASCEEDYVLSSLGFASLHNLPILFIIEDNNLSILTEKKIRRNWDIHKVAKAFNLTAFDTTDDPISILKQTESFLKSPTLINVKTNRLCWHAGSGIDNPDGFDRYKQEMNDFTIIAEARKIDKEMKEKMDVLWH